MKILGFKRAFSMIELILVMVVLGIVASMGATIIAQVYANYVLQKGMHHSSTKVEVAASIIYNRLSNRIASTTVGRDYSNDTLITHVNNITNPQLYDVLEWYGRATDSFNANENGTNNPTWSGVCDIDSNATTGLNIVTPGSNLSFLNTIVPNVSGSTVDDMALIFNDKTFSAGVSYDVSCMGYVNRNCIVRVDSITDDENIALDQNYAGIRIHEQYQLTRSAYALVPIKRTDITNRDLYTLWLYYDYQPWEVENYKNHSSKKILLDNVSVFRFSGTGDTLRFKICVDEQIGDSEYVSICKEKAVIR